MKDKVRCMIIANVMFFMLLPIKNAFAYLDPGTGSMMIQALLAVIAAVSVSIGVFWRRLRSFFSRMFGQNSSDKHEPNDS
jgi:hypothetical protein